MTDLYAKMIESEQAAVAAIEALGNSIKEHMNASAAYAENPTDETWQAFVQAVDSLAEHQGLVDKTRQASIEATKTWLYVQLIQDAKHKP